MYERKSRLRSHKRSRLIAHFAAGTTARAAAQLAGVNMNTAASFFTRQRQLIAEEMDKASPFFGEVEVDVSYFCGHRKGNRGCGTSGKVPVLGLLKRDEKVYTAMISNAQRAILLPIIERMILSDSIVYPNVLSSYDALDVSGFHNVRINRCGLFADRQNHINRVEHF